MLNGKTALVGIIGYPVGHSLSPLLHNAAFDVLGLNWRYVPLPVHPGDVGRAVQGLAALGFRGANVTVPHKQTVLPCLDCVDESVKKLGAVNTLVISEGNNEENNTKIIKGYNTDVGGFLAGLREGGFEPRQVRRVVVVGAGGAARAVVAALLDEGAEEIILLNRTIERAQKLARDLDGERGRVQALLLTQKALVEWTRVAQLIVNTTSVGMSPNVDESIWCDTIPFPSHLVVFDLVYNPLETKLLREARCGGALGIDGLGMLIHQAAIAFTHWTEQHPPLDEMKRVARAAFA